MTRSNLKAVAVYAAASFMTAVCGRSASAANVPIVNSDFETVFQASTAIPVTTIPLAASTSGTFTNSVFVNNSNPAAFNVDIPGWTATGDGGGIENLGTPYTPSDLTNSGYIGMFNPTPATISQTLGTNISASTIYTLSFEVNRRLDQTSVGTGGSDFPTSFSTSLLAGGVPLVATGLPSFSTPAAGASAPYSISFDSAQAFNLLQSGALGIEFSVVTGQVNIDNLVLTATPEPTSLSLVGLGAAGLLARRRKA